MRAATNRGGQHRRQVGCRQCHPLIRIEGQIGRAIEATIACIHIVAQKAAVRSKHANRITVLVGNIEIAVRAESDAGSTDQVCSRCDEIVDQRAGVGVEPEYPVIERCRIDVAIGTNRQIFSRTDCRCIEACHRRACRTV